MKNTYRSREPVSRLERLLARLLAGHQSLRPAEHRIDLGHNFEVQFSPSSKANRLRQASR